MDYIHDTDLAFIVVDRETRKVVRRFAYQERAEAFAQIANTRARRRAEQGFSGIGNIYKGITVSHVEVAA